jgi:hypothetical protein
MVENFKPIAIAGILRIRLARGPATPVSKRALLEETGLSILITAPNVPNGENGKGRKKGKVARIPYLCDMR